MAFSSSTHSRSGSTKWGSGKFSSEPLMAEINVTPMVDVMLVLLVIFMVTAPLLTVGVPVDLPQSQAQTLNENTEPLVISIDAQGEIFIQNTPVESENLARRLRAITKNSVDTRIYVRADRIIAYGNVMRVMGMISEAGYRRVALVSERPPMTGLPKK